MEKINRFNVRVYGLLIHQNSFLILNEYYAGEILNKLPGGGVELGEGLIDCLKRELKEELNLNLKKAEHFYTQEHFEPSKFRDNEQLLTIYYSIKVENITDLQVLDQSIQELHWIPMQELKPEHVSLPVDKKVISKLLKHQERINS